MHSIGVCSLSLIYVDLTVTLSINMSISIHSLLISTVLCNISLFAAFVSKCMRHEDCLSCIQDSCSRSRRQVKFCETVSACSWCPDRKQCLPAYFSPQFACPNDTEKDRPGQICQKSQDTAQQQSMTRILW